MQKAPGWGHKPPPPMAPGGPPVIHIPAQQLSGIVRVTVLVAVLGGVVPALVGVVAATGGAASLGGLLGPSWDGTSSFSCGGNDVVRIENVTARLTAGSAVQAGVNCKLELVNVDIEAPVGIEAGGNARVTLTKSRIVATRAGIEAGVNAQVTARESTITAQTAPGKTGAGDEPIAVSAQVNAKVDVGGCQISGPVALEAAMNGVVTIDGARVTGKQKTRMNGRIVGAAAK